MPGGKKGCAPKLIVRLVTAVPAGTPGKSGVPAGPLKKITLRALATATSMLKTVASGIRCRPRTVPFRSATAIVSKQQQKQNADDNPCGLTPTAVAHSTSKARLRDALGSEEPGKFLSNAMLIRPVGGNEGAGTFV